MRPLLIVLAVTAAMSWALIILNTARDLKRMLERERPEQSRPARDRHEEREGKD